MKTRLTRRRHFQCLHRYVVAAWSDARNLDTFGACFLPEGHGHDYWLEVTLEGEIDPVSGMVLNLVDVDHALKRVVSTLEGRRLDTEVAHFAGLVPTTEQIAAYLLSELERRFADQTARVVRLRLYESDDLWVDAWP